VFGVAAAMEAAAAPITAFLIAPIAEFLIIPYMKTAEGQRQWGWLLGEGDARGIALICLFAGLIMVVVGTLAFFTKSYRKLTELYATAPDPAPEQDGETDAGNHPDAVAAEDGLSDGVSSGRDLRERAGRVDAPPIVPGMPPEPR
jgi:DHA3 family multidrug efflux protein-like MFS transporter